MRSIQKKDGVAHFRVVCNETNNQQPNFTIDIYVKPRRGEWLQLNFVVSHASGDDFVKFAFKNERRRSRNE